MSDATKDDVTKTKIFSIQKSFLYFRYSSSNPSTLP